MSDSTTITPNDSVSQSGSGSSNSAGKQQQRRRKPNPVKQDARSKFNSSAPSISAEKFFSEFIEKKRNNVEIVFDTEVQGRIAEPYVTKARNHAINKYHEDQENKNLQASTYALTSFTLCRKMLLATPDSEEYELGKFRQIVKTELMAPKSVIAAVANVGKFELDDKVARLKYNSQDVFRMLMTTCKVMDQHTDYHGMYESGYVLDVVTVPWDQVDVTKCVITSESSVRWLRDEAVAFLDRAYETTWQVNYSPPPTQEVPEPEDILMQCSYPRLKIVKDADKQLELVVAWLGRLNAGMPGVQYVIAAGFAAAWKLLFFQRIGHLFRLLVPGLPDWIGNRPFDVLNTLGLHHFELSVDAFGIANYYNFILEIHHHLQLSVSSFAEFLDLAKQPDDKFGSSAQMLPFNPTDFQPAVFVGMEDFTYQKLRSDAQSVSVVKLKDKGDVVAGLSFAFARSVDVVPNYIGRLNGDPNNTRLQYLKPDFKNY